MPIAIGDKIPAGTFRYLGPDGPAAMSSDELFSGRKVAVFGMPGAYTGTCSGTHLPGVIAAEAPLKAKDVDDVVVLVVNDIFVMDAWAKSTGADATGLKMLTDPDAGFVKAMGMDFSVDVVGLIDRSQRFSMLVEDGVVKVLNTEEPGQCSVTAGEALVDQV